MKQLLALVSIETGEILAANIVAGEGRFVLPDGSGVSPVEAGWVDQGKVIVTNGPPRWRLLEIVQAGDAPEGKMWKADSFRYEIDGDVVREIADIEDLPEPLTKAERIEALLTENGFTLKDAEEVAVARKEAGAIKSGR